MIDATQAITAIHQNHDYAHVPGGEAEAWTGREAVRNAELAGQPTLWLNLSDVTHVLTPRGLMSAYRALGLGPHLYRRLQTLPDMVPALEPLAVWVRRGLRWYRKASARGH